MPEKFIVGNRFCDSTRVKTITNPYTNSAVGEVYLAGDSNFNESAEYLTKISSEYEKLPVYRKQELLQSISEKLNARKRDLAKIITDETGKPIKFSLIEIERAILTFALGAEECSRIEGEVLQLDRLKGSEGKMGIVKRFPVGMVLGITPWNFPVNLVAHKVSPALASSNVIMIKPSSNSMLSAIELGKLIMEACAENDITSIPLNVLTLSGPDIDKHVSDNRIKLISFTGSSDIGWGIKKKADRQKVSLELGGNAGVIVESDADVSAAAAKIAMGGFAQAGQSCISVQRVYINEKIYEEFRSKLIDAAEKIKYGNPYDEDTIVGPMITEDEALRAEKWINEAKSKGAKILTGGSRDKSVLQPTVIENAPNDSNVKCSEVFAPIITIEKITGFEEAVGEINNSRFGLQAGIFTKDIR
ncbi:MAG: aldehyde dehydrogenase family protein, partial [Ignavibacteria bacterium]